MQSADGWWIPLYCANCGRRGGMVPERMITFAFYLCDPCAETHGHPAHFYVEPDVVFWDRVRVAMLDEKIDGLTEIDMQAHANDSSSVIGKLLRERVALVSKEA